MKRHWTEEELIERWALMPDEFSLLANKSGATRLGFAVLLKFFAGDGRFPTNRGEVPWSVVSYVATQAAIPAEEYLSYDWQGRTIRYHRAAVRKHFGFREFAVDDGETLTAWLVEEVLPWEQRRDKLREAFFVKCRTLRLEPPADRRIERLLSSAEHRFEQGFCAAVFASLPDETVLKMDALLASGTGGEGTSDRRRSVLGWLRSDPGRVGLESVLDEIEKLRRVREVVVPEDLFAGVSPKVFEACRRRAATEKPSELAAHQPVVEWLDLLRRYAGNPARTYAQEEEVPVEGVVPPAWEDLVLSLNGSVRVERVGYEVRVLNALREALSLSFY